MLLVQGCGGGNVNGGLCTGSQGPFSYIAGEGHVSLQALLPSHLLASGGVPMVMLHNDITGGAGGDGHRVCCTL